MLPYPVPTCWLSRAGSTELALPGHHCGFGGTASPSAWDHCPSSWGCGGVPLVWGALDSPQEDAELCPPLAKAQAQLAAL